MLSLNNVSKTFDGTSQSEVLSNIDFVIERGEFICLLGASGCGKSTLLNIMAGFEVATSGSVMLEGRPLKANGGRSVMVAELVWLRIFQSPDWGLGAAISVVLVVFVGALMALLFRYVKPKQLV